MNDEPFETVELAGGGEGVISVCAHCGKRTTVPLSRIARVAALDDEAQRWANRAHHAERRLLAAQTLGLELRSRLAEAGRVVRFYAEMDDINNFEAVAYRNRFLASRDQEDTWSL
jgi:hypothetical protein